jgi:hypothetical protein
MKARRCSILKDGVDEDTEGDSNGLRSASPPESQARAERCEDADGCEPCLRGSRASRRRRIDGVSTRQVSGTGPTNSDLGPSPPIFLEKIPHLILKDNSIPSLILENFPFPM